MRLRSVVSLEKFYAIGCASSHFGNIFRSGVNYDFLFTLDLFNDGPGGMRRPPFGPRGGPFEGGPRFGGPPEGFEPFNRPPGGPGFRPDGPFNDNFNNFGGPPRGGRGGWRGGRGGRGGFDGPPPRGKSQFYNLKITQN